MANTVANNMPGIEEHWSLMAFAQSHGDMYVTDCQVKNPDSPDFGKHFKACSFQNPTTDEVIFVSFSRNLGELTPEQIASQKSDLQVVKLTSGNYSLCKKGNGLGQRVSLF